MMETRGRSAMTYFRNRVLADFKIGGISYDRGSIPKAPVELESAQSVRKLPITTNCGVMLSFLKEPVEDGVASCVCCVCSGNEL